MHILEVVGPLRRSRLCLLRVHPLCDMETAGLQVLTFELWKLASLEGSEFGVDISCRWAG